MDTREIDEARLTKILVDTAESLADRLGMEYHSLHKKQIVYFSNDTMSVNVSHGEYVGDGLDAIMFRYLTGDEIQCDFLFVVNPNSGLYRLKYHTAHGDGEETEKEIMDGFVAKSVAKSVARHRTLTTDSFLSYIQLLDLSVMLVAFSIYAVGNMSVYSTRKAIPLYFVYYEYPYQRECCTVFLVCLIVFLILCIIRKAVSLFNR